MDIIGIQSTDRQAIEQALAAVAWPQHISYKLITDLSYNKGWSVIICSDSNDDVVEIPSSTLESLSVKLQVPISVVPARRNRQCLQIPIVSSRPTTRYDRNCRLRNHRCIRVFF